MLEIINENPLFDKVRTHTTVKVELVKRERKPLEQKKVECINILEDIISSNIFVHSIALIPNNFFSLFISSTLTVV